tara:strand:- start:8 stop:871 length:864 start_codon:yes stop_codon:yes gene_type:complete
MKKRNSKSKYRILVLMDPNQKSYSALINAVNLAKAIDGTISVFQVKLPTGIVKNENQISALRAIKQERKATRKKLHNIMNLVSEVENIPINYAFSFGNVKNEIKLHLQQTKPDIVVLGKKKQKLINLLGDGITKFLLANHSGAILINGGNKNLLANTGISLGFYSDTLNNHDLEITKALSKRTTAPVKIFSVRKRVGSNEEKVILKRLKSDPNVQNMIEYEFEESVSALDGLASYVLKNSIGVLCVGRGSKRKGWSDRLIGDVSKVHHSIQKLNVPLLVLGDREYTV